MARGAEASDVDVLFLVEEHSGEHEPGMVLPDAGPNLHRFETGLLVELSGGRQAGWLSPFHAATRQLPPGTFRRVHGVEGTQKQYPVIRVENDHPRSLAPVCPHLRRSSLSAHRHVAEHEVTPDATEGSLSRSFPTATTPLNMR